jgi:hypothetical protein
MIARNFIPTGRRVTARWRRYKIVPVLKKIEPYAMKTYGDI